MYVCDAKTPYHRIWSYFGNCKHVCVHTVNTEHCRKPCVSRSLKHKGFTSLRLWLISVYEFPVKMPQPLLENRSWHRVTGALKGVCRRKCSQTAYSFVWQHQDDLGNFSWSLTHKKLKKENKWWLLEQRKMEGKWSRLGNFKCVKMWQETELEKIIWRRIHLLHITWCLPVGPKVVLTHELNDLCENQT